MPKYIYQDKDWPCWKWDNERILSLLTKLRHQQGLLYGRMQSLGFDIQNEAHLEVLTADIAKSALIEGEYLADNEVRSSIARHLGIERGGLIPSSKNVDGFVTLILDAISCYQEKLTKERLFIWHKIFLQNRTQDHMPI